MYVCVNVCVFYCLCEIYEERERGVCFRQIERERERERRCVCVCVCVVCLSICLSVHMYVCSSLSLYLRTIMEGIIYIAKS